MTSTWNPCESITYYRNEGDGTFADETETAGLAGQLGGLNITQTDYNNDGWMDVLVMRGGWMKMRGQMRMSLLRNNGDGTFTDVTEDAGLARPAYPSQSAAWADYDNDGDLDLFSCNESMKEAGVESTALLFPSQLFRNDGAGRFEDVAQEAGVQNWRYCKGSAWGDYNGDGLPDLYVSNFGDANRLYRNNGDGTFSDVAAELGVEEPLDSFATWFWDYDNDGWFDIFVAGYGEDIEDVAADYLGLETGGAMPRLYRNSSGRKFDDVTREVGLEEVRLTMGANFGDLDNDGYPDFLLGTGAPSYDAIAPNVMYRNDAGARFQDVTFSGGFGHLQKGPWRVLRRPRQGWRPGHLRADRGLLSGRRLRERAVREPGQWESLAFSETSRNRVEPRCDWRPHRGQSPRSRWRDEERVFDGQQRQLIRWVDADAGTGPGAGREDRFAGSTLAGVGNTADVR